MRSLKVLTSVKNTIKITPDKIELGIKLGEMYSPYIDIANYVCTRLNQTDNYVGEFTEKGVELRSDSMYYVFNLNGVLLRATKYEQVLAAV